MPYRRGDVSRVWEVERSARRAWNIDPGEIPRQSEEASRPGRTAGVAAAVAAASFLDSAAIGTALRWQGGTGGASGGRTSGAAVPHSHCLAEPHQRRRPAFGCLNSVYMLLSHARSIRQFRRDGFRSALETGRFHELRQQGERGAPGAHHRSPCWTPVSGRSLTPVRALVRSERAVDVERVCAGGTDQPDEAVALGG